MRAAGQVSTYRGGRVRPSGVQRRVGAAAEPQLENGLHPELRLEGDPHRLPTAWRQHPQDVAPAGPVLPAHGDLTQEQVDGSARVRGTP
ncbi:MAG: hypothetical protein BGO38_16640 [Cellulomonas sp. 73-145]|nr:MAG: hypothetical protein BGO38_16640 [Cellulomonas sp. 73-145]